MTNTGKHGEPTIAAQAPKFSVIRKYRAQVMERLVEVYYRLLAHTRYLCSSRRQPNHSLPGKLIISLTSYPARFPTLHLTIRTLLSQSICPDLVVLWLYEPDLEKLPANTQRLIGKSFEVRSVERDIRSYKKLIPPLETHPSAFIVTADDDLYYKRSWLCELVDSYSPGRREIVCHRAHRIVLDHDASIAPYDQWEGEISDSTSGTLIFPTTGGGVLIPPGIFDSEVHDEQVFMTLCPTSDDVWFYFMVRRAGCVCRKIGPPLTCRTWNGSQERALYFENAHQQKNDVAIANLLRRFGNPTT